MSTPPVPKPRACYRREGLSGSSDRDVVGEDLLPAAANDIQRSAGTQTDEAPPPRECLSGVSDVISANIPSLAMVTRSIPTPASAPPPPPGLDSMANSIATHIPSLAGAANAVANPAMLNPATSPPGCGTASPDVASLDNIVSLLATNIPSLAGIVSCVANPAVSRSAGAASPISSMMIPGAVSNPAAAMCHHDNLNPAVIVTTPTPTTPSAPPLAPPTTALVSLEDGHTDLEALSRMVLAALDPTATSTVSPTNGATSTLDEVRLCHRHFVGSPELSLQNCHSPICALPGSTLLPPLQASSPSPMTMKGEKPYITVFAHFGSQEDSSNEEEDTGVGPASSAVEGALEGDLAPNHPSNANNITTSQSGRPPPSRPAPPLPCPASQEKPLRKRQTPRAATIRVSRKKGSATRLSPQGAVVRASWLDVWKGFRHNVVWATLDGQLMSLWKKRTDRFSEVLFHVSSITNVKKQDKGRFSVYFKKKHYDFMAHNDDVQDGWLTSLLACRGQPSPAPPELHGPITIKDPRSRAYAAVWAHNLWIYDNKAGFQLGVASFSVPLNVASVKSTGKHSFTLITPYKSFRLSVDSSKDLSGWLGCLSSSIRSALSCSQVALRLWENPSNKVCGDCGSTHPEWASVNLLLIICEACACQHRSLGSSHSKVRSLTLDNKVWTEPLIQLFVTYGNRLANQVWSPVVPAAEQLRPESSDEERAEFILNKYSRGRYRRLHPLACSHSLMTQRLCEVVCGDDVEETMSLLCSGAKVSPSDPQSPAPIQLAERAGQALQAELLRHNEYTNVPPYLPQATNMGSDSASPGEEEELHGKLEEDRFLFSLENDSAACDVLDLREVLSVCLTHGPGHEFEMVTLNDLLSCAADTQEALLSHLVHILKVILPGGVSEREVGRALAVSKVCVMEVGEASDHSDGWLVLWVGGVTIYPTHNQTKPTLRTKLDALTHYKMNPSENTIDLVKGDRNLSLRFEKDHSCHSWFHWLQRAIANQSSACQRSSSANQCPTGGSPYDLIGSVPPALERCISHVTKHGLKVEGVYRRCGLATKVSRLVEALMTSPASAPLESDEQGVLDAAAALKQYVRQQEALLPPQDRELWEQAAAVPDERSRFSAYRRLLRQLPDDNRATLNALFGHFYMVQLFSQINRMSAQNLSLVLVPSLFQTVSLILNQDLTRLIRELIIHHTLLFLTPEEEEDEEEQITVL